MGVMKNYYSLLRAASYRYDAFAHYLKYEGKWALDTRFPVRFDKVSNGPEPGAVLYYAVRNMSIKDRNNFILTFIRHRDLEWLL